MDNLHPTIAAAALPCCVKIYPRESFGLFHSHPCQSKAKVEREGKWYCGTHDPVKIKARKDAQCAKWKAESDARQLSYAQKAKDARRAEAYPRLVEVLREYIEYLKAYCLSADVDDPAHEHLARKIALLRELGEDK